ncbi:hypothetical protein ACYATP_00020 [Lactobacillaceae bacterium Melli_B4]
MKLKNIFTSTLVSVTFLYLGTYPLLASASAWKNGLPSFVKVSKDKAWMSTRKEKIEKYYSRTVLIPTNGGGLGETSRAFDHSGKSAPIGGSGAPILPEPYYKKISNNNYLVKTKISQGSPKPQGKFEKNGKSIKVWLNEDAKKWKYLGTFKKVNLKHVDKYEKDPLR